MTFSIGGVEIGGSNPCRFVAEISCNHGGDSDRLVRMVKAAKAAGADLVKFQCYTPDELVALRGDGPAPSPWGENGFTMRSLYDKAQTPLEWFEWIPEVCGAVGIDWFSSVFGEVSMRVLRAAHCAAYKIARLDNQHLTLAAMARMAGKPVIVSSAGESVPSFGLTDIAAKLFCPVGYPQQKFGLDWSLFHEQNDDLGHYSDAQFDGFSYHGTSIEPPVVAATLGAKIIEAHFQLDEERSELENHVSLRQSDFRAMVDRVRRVEEMLA